MTHEEAVARCRASYTDPAVAIAELEAMPPVRRLEEAHHRYSVALYPAGRFGLDACSQEILDTYYALMIAASIGCEPLRRFLREARGRGLSWGEVWPLLRDDERLASYGAEPGDAGLLGVLDATMDPALAARLEEGRDE